MRLYNQLTSQSMLAGVRWCWSLPVPPHICRLPWYDLAIFGLIRSSILASSSQSLPSLLSLSSPYRFPLVYVEIPGVCRAVPSLGGQLPSGFRVVVVVAVAPRAAAVVSYRTRRTCSVGSILLAPHLILGLSGSARGAPMSFWVA